MAELELVPDRELLNEILHRFEDAAFVGMRTGCPPDSKGELTIQTSGCLYRLETLCGDLSEFVRFKRESARDLRDWEEK